MKVDETAVAKLFEEVKVMFATLPERLEDRLRETVRRKASPRRRMHPGMLEEFLFNPILENSQNGRTTGWLMFINAFKEDLPWFYDLGMELYRALCAQDQRAIEVAGKGIMAALDMTKSPRSMRYLGAEEDQEIHMMLRHLPQIIEPYLERLVSEQSTTRRFKRKNEPETPQ
jgi:hypothetical protein